MPKLKTRRAAHKRFRVTGGGKFMRRRAFKSHILTKKSRKRKRALRHPVEVSRGERRVMRRTIPYA